MRISIFGMGYVGVVSAVCLARLGHEIIGVDTNVQKIEMLRKGISPIIEDQVPALLEEAVRMNRLSVTEHADEAFCDSEASIVCVGTPSQANGSLDTVYLENVCQQMGASLKTMNRSHIIIFRSTMLPGTVTNSLVPILEASSGKKEGVDFFVAFNPEFLRESTAVNDFNHPPKTVVGCDNEEIAAVVMSIYSKLPGPKITCALNIAEMVKYVDNNFHAVKITFANEIGMVCKSLGIDSHEVMNIFKQDESLNISRAYLTPGFAFGGSCLPKDLRAINYLAKMLDLELPLLDSLLKSNNRQIANGIRKVLSSDVKKIGFAGLSFKEGTDDMRESPVVEVIETLIGKGCDVRIYDRNVSMARLMGANRDYIENRIPHISSLLVESLDELVRHADLLIITNREPEFASLAKSSGKKVLDLVRMDSSLTSEEGYEGLYW